MLRTTLLIIRINATKNSIDFQLQFLQIIDVTEFNKLLGSEFNYEMLRELLKILSENFISDNIPVTGILKQIAVHREFKILKMFMDTEDRNGKYVYSTCVFAITILNTKLTKFYF